MKQWLILAVLLLRSFQLLIAQDTLIISDQKEEYLLTRKPLYLYKDSSGLLDHRTVSGEEFVPGIIDQSTTDFKTVNFWLRFTVKNTSSSEKWLIELFDFGIEKVAFYDLRIDSLIETGYSRPFITRGYKHKNFVFDLLIPPGETGSFLVKVSSSSGYGPVLKIRSNALFISYATKEYLLLGFYYGLLTLIVLYNFFLFINIRDRSHLYYVFYVISIGLRSLQGDGLGFQYLWSSFPQINAWLNFAPQLLLVSFSIYAIHFLELRKKHLFYYKAVQFSLAFYLGLYLTDIFLPIEYLQLAYLIPFFMIYGISIMVYRKGYKPARFFILGYSLFILSQVAYFIFSRGIQLENDLIIMLFVYSLNIGFVAEAFIFSIALADKIKIFKKEKEQAYLLIINQQKINEELKDKVNRELELKVSERTKELEDAKIKLQEQADKINDMNRLLDLENYQLKNNVKEINMERGLLKALVLDEFIRTFPNESACYRFIEELKWDKGFACNKCGNEKYSQTKDPFARKCTKCNYIETIKANTIFHNLKFPIEKAFQLVYLTLSSEKEASTYELARKLKLQQKTCWSFRQKIMEKMRKERISKKDLLEKGWSILIKE